jgi:nuclear cap-binding protein subunit 2
MVCQNKRGGRYDRHDERDEREREPEPPAEDPLKDAKTLYVGNLYACRS